MKHKRVVAALALAFALGIGISFFDLSTDPSTSASELAEGEISELPVEPERLDESEAEVAEEIAAMPLADTAVLSNREVTLGSDEDPKLLATYLNDTMISKVTLMGDITMNSRITLKRDANSPVVLDLNGHNLIGTTGKAYAIRFSYGDLTITGRGTVSGKNGIEVYGSNDPTVQKFSHLTIDKDVTISAQVYSIAVTYAANNEKVAYGVDVDVKGALRSPYAISIEGGVQNTSNAPKITIDNGAVLDTVTGITGGGAPVYAAGFGDWTFNRANIYGVEAIGIKAGTLTFNNTNVNIIGEEPEDDPDLATGRIDGTAAVFQMEHNAQYADSITLNINGGNYTSAHSHVFFEYGELPGSGAAGSTAPTDINITAGTFTAGAGKAIFDGKDEENFPVDIEISGGTFNGTDTGNFAEAGYLVSGMTVDANGNVVAARPARPSRPAHSSSSNLNRPETPVADDKEDQPSKDPEPADMPNTGAILGQGISSAVSTLAPVLGLAALVTMVYGCKVFRRRHAAQMAAAECEINAELHELVEPEEPVQDNFVATPMTATDAEEMRMNMFFPKPKKSENSEK